MVYPPAVLTGHNVDLATLIEANVLTTALHRQHQYVFNFNLILFAVCLLFLLPSLDVLTECLLSAERSCVYSVQS